MSTLTNHYGPMTEAADQLHAEKYRLPGESFRDAMNRVAGAMADEDNEEHYHDLRNILLNQRFLPAGRIQSAMGSGRQVTAFNCFVSGTIRDSMNEGDQSIMGRQAQAVETMRRGGGIGYDFSDIRPRGASIKKLHSTASGPVSFMHAFDAWGKAISSSGHRRGAQMGVMRVDHPDIEEFIRAKSDGVSLRGFNISVGVTDAFMEALDADGDFDLVFGCQVTKTVRARDLWEQIMRSTWDYDDPGVLFIDRINERNALNYCETIAATNPCGEQPLPPFGACLLGSFNLVRYLRRVWNDWSFDYALLSQDVAVVVRAMDNVIDRTSYPLFEQEEEAKSKRRMGLGVTGVANAIEALGHRYGSGPFCQTLKEILIVIANQSYQASAGLALERGSFPLYNAEKYKSSWIFKRLGNQTQRKIEKHGLRNSHLLSIAPTGTISQCADNVSSGIEPTFAREIRRLIKTADGEREVTIKDYAVANGLCDPTPFDEVSVEDHLAVLSTASAWVDSGVSKTINMRPDVSWDDFKATYLAAYDLECKGVTTYVPKAGKAAVLVKAEESADTCVIDPNTGARDCG